MVKILTLVVAQRRRIVEETDNNDDSEEDPDISTIAKMKGPSSEALGKMTDYCRSPTEFEHPLN